MGPSSWSSRDGGIFHFLIVSRARCEASEQCFRFSTVIHIVLYFVQMYNSADVVPDVVLEVLLAALVSDLR